MPAEMFLFASAAPTQPTPAKPVAPEITENPAPPGPPSEAEHAEPASGNAPLPERVKPDILLLTEREAAEVLAISPRKLWELRMCGKIPCVRIGRAVRYDPADLKAWITQQKAG